MFLKRNFCLNIIYCLILSSSCSVCFFFLYVCFLYVASVFTFACLITKQININPILLNRGLRVEVFAEKCHYQYVIREFFFFLRN